MHITITVVLVSLALTMPLRATGMLVHKADGTTDTIDVRSVEHMKFAAEPAATRPDASSLQPRVPEKAVRVSPDGIVVHMPRNGDLTIQVSDIRGRIVGTFSRRDVAAGTFRFKTGISFTPGAGMYIVRVWADGTQHTVRTLTLR